MGGRRRGLRWALVALLVVGVPGALWVASSAGVSPAQRAADADPPPPPVVEGEIELRQLKDVAVFHGVVAAVGSQTVTAPDLYGWLPVIVELPVQVGGSVTAGDVIAVVSDRPVIVMLMRVPLYRTLGLGSEGEDVARFQTALVGLGYTTPVDGEFGFSTQDATRAFYRDRGFETVSSDTDIEPGVVVPLGEIVGVAAFPAVVSQISATIGGIVAGPILTISTSSLVVDASVDAALVPLLAPGVSATVTDHAWQLEVLSNDGQDELGRPLVRFRVMESLPAELLGTEVRIEAVLAATAGQVLAVPLAAIRSEGDHEVLRVVDPSGDIRVVRVRTGASIGGWVEIVEADLDLTPGMVLHLG